MNWEESQYLSLLASCPLPSYLSVNKGLPPFCIAPVVGFAFSSLVCFRFRPSPPLSFSYSIGYYFCLFSLLPACYVGQQREWHVFPIRDPIHCCVSVRLSRGGFGCLGLLLRCADPKRFSALPASLSPLISNNCVISYFLSVEPVISVPLPKNRKTDQIRGYKRGNVYKAIFFWDKKIE